MKINFRKLNWLLIFIVFTAFIFRIIGLFYSYPLNVVYDESTVLSAALKMLGTQTLRANAFQNYYPAGLTYVYLPFLATFLGVGRLVGFFPNLEAMKEAVLLHLGMFLPIARAVSALLGTLSVYLIYKITRQLFAEKKISLLAAWFAAVSFFLVADAHFGRTWTAQAFFILLIFYWAVKFYRQEKISLRAYLLGGFLVGLAFSINFVGIIGYFWFLLAHYLKNKGRGFIAIFIKNRYFWLGNLVVVLFVPLIYYLNPFGFNNYFYRVVDISLPAISGSGAYKLFSFLTVENFWFYLKNSFMLEPVFCILAAIASAILWRKQKIIFCFTALWLPIYYLLLSPQTTLMTRYILPVMPVIIILAAYAVYYCWRKFSGRHSILIILALVLSLPTLVFSLLFDIRMTRSDTRALAMSWLTNNLPDGASVDATDVGTEFTLVENKQAVALVKEKKPDAFSTARKYLLSLNDESYPRPAYFVVYYQNLLPENYSFDYTVLESFNREDLQEKTQRLPANQKLIKIFYPLYQTSFLPGRPELQVPFNDATFNPLSLLRLSPAYGPYIEIYEFKK